MSSIATLNGVQYIIPAYNDTGWAQGAGNLSLYLAAIAANTFQPSGGSFTLTAEADFGASFGLKALYLKTETANPSSTGVIRLAKSDTVSFRNNANSGDIALSKSTSDLLQWNSNTILVSGVVVNGDINASAGIAYSKLNLTGSVVNADISSSAAIAYSKLALTGTIVNADVASAAAIAVNKLAALTVSRAVATDGSGFLVAATTTATELGYVNGVTSAIQTQMNLKAPLASPTFTGTVTVPNGSASTNAAAYGQLKLLQTVTAIDTAATTGTSSTFFATTTTAKITPTSASNRVKISVTGQLRAAAAAYRVEMTIKRGSTNLGDATHGFTNLLGIGATSTMEVPCSVIFVDSPATTSETTYTVYIRSSDNSSTSQWNGDAGVANITLEEIA